MIPNFKQFDFNKACFTSFSNLKDLLKSWGALKSLRNREKKKQKSGVRHFRHQKRLPYQIQGDKTVKNVQIDPLTEIWSTKLNVTL